MNSTRQAIQDHYQTNVDALALIAQIDAATEHLPTREQKMNPSQLAAHKARHARRSTLIPR